MEAPKHGGIKVSHQTEIKLKVKNMSAMKAACEALGLELVKDAQCRGYYSTMQRDYIVRLRGKYDVGLTLEKDGSYSVDADFWDGYVAKEVGENCGTLMQKYGEKTVEEAAQIRGMSIYTEELESGDVKMTLTQYE
jgi:hypothetical protein